MFGPRHRSLGHDEKVANKCRCQLWVQPRQGFHITNCMLHHASRKEIDIKTSDPHAARASIKALWHDYQHGAGELQSQLRPTLALRPPSSQAFARPVYKVRLFLPFQNPIAPMMLVMNHKSRQMRSIQTAFFILCIPESISAFA
jgi:hypothetical protein